jgi:uncharacterized protein YjaZ
MKRIVYFLVLFVFLSCSKNDISFERAKISVRGQEIEILTAYKIFDNYLLNKKDYFRSVYQNIEREFIENAEYPFLLETIKREIKPDQRLKEATSLLKQCDILNIVDSSFQKIIKELPGPKTKILIIPANPEYRAFYKQYKVGVAAITVGAGKIIVSIDPTSNYWEVQLPYVLAHEYHHSVWTSRNFTTVDFTPLEYLVLEGKADSFAKNLFPNIDMPHTKMIDENKERLVWDLIKPELNNRKSEMNDLMMIGNEDIPACSGYTIGFNIVELYKRNNQNVHDSLIIDIEPEQILFLSKYDE